jgi:hypothetical protein
VRAFVKMEDRKLAAIAEEALKEMGLSYIKNQGLNVTEFEVRAPRRYLVTVDNLAREHVGLFFRRKVKVDSAVEAKPLIGSPEPEAVLKEQYDEFFDRLREKLPEGALEGLRA